jgi:diguanylate cyclase (GGDEF)-like protein
LSKPSSARPPRRPQTAAPPKDAATPRSQEEKDFLRWMSRDLAVLDYFAGVPERVPRELWMALETLRARKDKELYQELLYALTHKFFPAEDAKKLWDAIVRHKRELSAKLGRDVGMKVAVLDHLDNEAGRVKDLQLLPADDLDSLLLFANEDGLSGLYNHRYFQERLRYEVARCLRYRHALSLLFVDLDRFKRYNDEYGHLKGDVLIRDVSAYFKLSCREADAVARYGGDEFAFILPETNAKQALVVAERLRTKFNSRHLGSPAPGVVRSVTLSIGIGCLPGDARTAEDLIEAADRALYRAKQAGRDRIMTAGRRSAAAGRGTRSR